MLEKIQEYLQSVRLPIIMYNGRETKLRNNDMILIKMEKGGFCLSFTRLGKLMQVVDIVLPDNKIFIPKKILQNDIHPTIMWLESALGVELELSHQNQTKLLLRVVKRTWDVN